MTPPFMFATRFNQAVPLSVGCSLFPLRGTSQHVAGFSRQNHFGRRAAQTLSASGAGRAAIVLSAGHLLFVPNRHVRSRQAASVRFLIRQRLSHMRQSVFVGLSGYADSGAATLRAKPWYPRCKGCRAQITSSVRAPVFPAAFSISEIRLLWQVGYHGRVCLHHNFRQDLAAIANSKSPAAMFNSHCVPQSALTPSVRKDAAQSPCRGRPFHLFVRFHERHPVRFLLLSASVENSGRSGVIARMHAKPEFRPRTT